MKYFSKDNFLAEKIYYISIMIFLFIIFLKVLIIDKDYSVIFLLLIPILQMVLLVSDIIKFYGFKNIINNKLNMFFKEILKFIEFELLEIKNNSEKLPLKIAMYRLTYLFVFFIIPLTFMLVVLTGSYQNQPSVISSSGAFYNNYSIGEKEISETGIIKIIPVISKDDRAKLSYLTGDLLNLPILNLCFSNNGTSYNNDTDFETFKSRVIIFNKEVQVQANSKTCLPLNSENLTVEYEWMTKYKYSVLNRFEINNRTDFSSEPYNRVSIEVSTENFISMTTLVVLAWMAICNLIFNVIRDFKSIK